MWQKKIIKGTVIEPPILLCMEGSYSEYDQLIALSSQLLQAIWNLFDQSI